MTTTTIPDHPAAYSKAVLAAMRDVLSTELVRMPWDEEEEYPTEPMEVWDPYGGIGRIHDLHEPGLIHTRAGELEPEWAAAHERTEVADALACPYDTGTFHVVATSPCYGNRMADKHEAKDRCKTCAGLKVDPDHEGDGAPGPCPNCKGTGLSVRNTYRHKLGRPLTRGSAGGMPWQGPHYRAHHEAAAREMVRVLVEDGLLIVNMKNHLTDNGQVEQHVTEWWVNLLLRLGCRIVEVRPVSTPGQRKGANRHRTESEFIIVMRTPTVRRLL